MIIVVTAEQDIDNELQSINSILDTGLKLLHVRKYNFSDDDMCQFIHGIDPQYRNRLVMHSHHHLAEMLNLNRLHFNEKDRKAKKQDQYSKVIIRSTSVHSIADFNQLDKQWSYALLSPMFSSISKPGHGKEHTVRHELKLRNNQQVQLIGLAGIHDENIIPLYEDGVDGVALLGAIWNSDQPVLSLKKCLFNDLSYPSSKI
jgi:thiamine-phosphate pyrophosphorylase